VRTALARQLKRVLADEQNEVLHRLGQRNASLAVDDVLRWSSAASRYVPGGGRGPPVGGGHRGRALPVRSGRRGAARRAGGPLGPRPLPRHPRGRAGRPAAGAALGEPRGGGRRGRGGRDRAGDLPRVEGPDRRARRGPGPHRVRTRGLRRAQPGHAGVLGAGPVRAGLPRRGGQRPGRPGAGRRALPDGSSVCPRVPRVPMPPRD
jgi:hypothetical protein